MNNIILVTTFYMSPNVKIDIKSDIRQLMRTMNR